MADRKASAGVDSRLDYLISTQASRGAALYDARGETGKASAARARLLQLWRRPDPELQSVLAGVRAKVPG